MSITRLAWPASMNAVQAADWPRLAEAWGSLRRDLALRGASGAPAGRGLSPLVLDIGEHVDDVAGARVLELGSGTGA